PRPGWRGDPGRPRGGRAHRSPAGARGAGRPVPCGRSGHLEGLASGPAIVRLAARLGARDQHGRTPADGHALACAAAAGEDAAAEAYRIAGFATGRVVGGVLNVLDAEVVALTGGVSEAESPWRTALDAGLAHDAMDVVAETP